MIRTLFTAACSLILATGLIAEDVKEVTLKPSATNPLAYDDASKAFTVKAGQKVKITLDNPVAAGAQIHNLLVCKPGSLMKVGAAANALLSDPQAMAKNYIPESEDIIHHTNLVMPGQKGVLEFTAPTEPGDYPYLCTFPGHFMFMNGVMKVEK